MNSGKPKFLTVAEVLFLHEESLARYGGSPGIREAGLIDSALGAAQNTFWYGRGNVLKLQQPMRFTLPSRRHLLTATKGRRQRLPSLF